MQLVDDMSGRVLQSSTTRRALWVVLWGLIGLAVTYVVVMVLFLCFMVLFDDLV